MASEPQTTETVPICTFPDATSPCSFCGRPPCEIGDCPRFRDREEQFVMEEIANGR